MIINRNAKWSKKYTKRGLWWHAYGIEIIFYSFLGDSITFTCILQRKLNLSHSFFSCCDRWSWGKVCILVECQLLKLCHHTSQLGFHFLVAFKRSVWNKLIIINGTNAVTEITGYFLCDRHNISSIRQNYSWFYTHDKDIYI